MGRDNATVVADERYDTRKDPDGTYSIDAVRSGQIATLNRVPQAGFDVQDAGDIAEIRLWSQKQRLPRAREHCV